MAPQPYEARVGEQFDRIAASYDTTEDPASVRAQVRASAIAAVRAARPATVLDVGCGTGTLLLTLADGLRSGVGLDVSRKMLAVAGRKAQNRACRHISFRLAGFSDLASLATDAAFRFDAVVAVYALHHLTTAQKLDALRGMAALLTARGRLVVGDLIFFDDPAKHSGEFDAAAYDPDTDYGEPAPAIAAMLAECGLETQSVQVHSLAGVAIGDRKGGRAVPLVGG